MNKDKSQDKYNEIIQNLKEEKMDWDFEDFLIKAEGGEHKLDDQAWTPIIPIDEKKKILETKWLWIAASLVLLISMGFVFSYNESVDVKNQDQLVENQIRQQKKDFIEVNNEHHQQIAMNSIEDSIAGVKKDSILQESAMAEKDVMDAILSKRGRLKKEKKPRYVNNLSSKSLYLKDSLGYKDSYVIVNGQKIDNLEEAIDVTKYSFQIVANNMSEKLISSTMGTEYDDF